MKVRDSRKFVRIKKNLLKALDSEELQDKVMKLMAGQLVTDGS